MVTSMITPTAYLKLGLSLLSGGFFLLVACFFMIRGRRRAQDVPFSKIRSLAVGNVRVKGRLFKNPEEKGRIIAPLSGKECLLYIISIQDLYLSKGASGWRILSSTGEISDFYVQDDSGRVLVNPSGVAVVKEAGFRFTTLPFRKTPPQIAAVIASRRINKKRKLLGIPLPWKKILRIEETVLIEGEEMLVSGYAEPYTGKAAGRSQSERLIITRTETGLLIRSPKVRLVSDRTLLRSLVLGALFTSVGFGLVARFYEQVNSAPTFLALTVGGTALIILSIVGYYKRWWK